MKDVEWFTVTEESVSVTIKGWGLYKAKDRKTWERWLHESAQHRMRRYHEVRDVSGSWVDDLTDLVNDLVKFGSLPDFVQACVVAEWES